MLVSCYRAQARDRCTKVRSVIVPEFDDRGMFLQGGLNNSALNSTSASVDKPHFVESCCGSGGYVFINH